MKSNKTGFYTTGAPATIEERGNKRGPDGFVILPSLEEAIEKAEDEVRGGWGTKRYIVEIVGVVQEDKPPMKFTNLRRTQ